VNAPSRVLDAWPSALQSSLTRLRCHQARPFTMLVSAGRPTGRWRAGWSARRDRVRATGGTGEFRVPPGRARSAYPSEPLVASNRSETMRRRRPPRFALTNWLEHGGDLRGVLPARDRANSQGRYTRPLCSMLIHGKRGRLCATPIRKELPTTKRCRRQREHDFVGAREYWISQCRPQHEHIQ